jgi:hypothetical protein
MERKRQLIIIGVALVVFGLVTYPLIHRHLERIEGHDPSPELKVNDIVDTEKIIARPANDRAFWKSLGVGWASVEPPKEGEELNPNDFNFFLLQSIWSAAIEGQEKWVPSAKKILEEYVKNKWPIQLSEDKSTPTIQSTQTAAEIAFALRVLKDKLEPELEKSIKEKLYSENITPFLNKYKLPVANGSLTSLTDTNSQNLDSMDFYTLPTITANVLFTACMIVDDKNELKEILEVARDIGNWLLNNGKPENITQIGLSNWNLGFDHLVIISELLLHTTKGKIDLYAHPNFPSYALFPYALKIDDFDEVEKRGERTLRKLGTIQPTIGDTKLKEYRRFEIESILNKRIDLNLETPNKGDWDIDTTTRNRIFMLTLTPDKFSYTLKKPDKEEIIKNLPKNENIISSVTRLRDVAFYMKRGGDKLPYSHEDIGSYTILTKKKDKWGYLAGDYWRGEYKDSGFFRSGITHPLPLINDEGPQMTCDSGINLIEAFEETKDLLFVKINLTKLYSKFEELEALNRVVVFNKNTGILFIRDHLKSKSNVRLGTRVLFEGDTNVKDLLRVKGSGKIKSTKWLPRDVGMMPEQLLPQAITLKTAEAAKESWIEYKISPNGDIAKDEREMLWGMEREIGKYQWQTKEEVEKTLSGEFAITSKHETYKSMLELFSSENSTNLETFWLKIKPPNSDEWVKILSNTKYNQTQKNLINHVNNIYQDPPSIKKSENNSEASTLKETPSGFTYSWVEKNPEATINVRRMGWKFPYFAGVGSIKEKKSPPLFILNATIETAYPSRPSIEFFVHQPYRFSGRNIVINLKEVALNISWPINCQVEEVDNGHFVLSPLNASRKSELSYNIEVFRPEQQTKLRAYLKELLEE